MTALDIARVRPVIESEIDRLIAILDMLEPDPDFEESTDLEEDTSDEEPLLGAPNARAGSWGGIDASFGCDDGEELELGWTELEARFGRYGAAGADVYEPSLGSLNGINQKNWSKGADDDLEVEFDGREVDTDFELVDEREPFGEGSSCYAGPAARSQRWWGICEGRGRLSVAPFSLSRTGKADNHAIPRNSKKWWKRTCLICNCKLPCTLL